MAAPLNLNNAYIYVNAYNNGMGMDDPTGNNGYRPAQWFSVPDWLANLFTVGLPNQAAPPASAPAPGPAVIYAGDVHVQPWDVYGPVLLDANGIYYGPHYGWDYQNAGSYFPLIGTRADGQQWTFAAIQQGLVGASIVAQQAAAHNASHGGLTDLFNNPLYKIVSVIYGAYSAYSYFGIDYAAQADAMNAEFSAQAAASDTALQASSQAAEIAAQAQLADQAAQVAQLADQAAQVAQDAQVAEAAQQAQAVQQAAQAAQAANDAQAAAQIAQAAQDAADAQAAQALQAAQDAQDAQQAAQEAAIAQQNAANAIEAQQAAQDAAVAQQAADAAAQQAAQQYALQQAAQTAADQAAAQAQAAADAVTAAQQATNEYIAQANLASDNTANAIDAAKQAAQVANDVIPPPSIPDPNAVQPAYEGGTAQAGWVPSGDLPATAAEAAGLTISTASTITLTDGVTAADAAAAASAAAKAADVIKKGSSLPSWVDLATITKAAAAAGAIAKLVHGSSNIAPGAGINPTTGLPYSNINPSTGLPYVAPGVAGAGINAQTLKSLLPFAAVAAVVLLAMPGGKAPKGKHT